MERGAEFETYFIITWERGEKGLVIYFDNFEIEHM